MLGNLFVLTVAFTVAILLAGVISTVVIFAVMSNPKAVKWFTGWYINQMEKAYENFEKEFKID